MSGGPERHGGRLVDDAGLAPMLSAMRRTGSSMVKVSGPTASMTSILSRWPACTQSAATSSIAEPCPVGAGAWDPRLRDRRGGARLRPAGSPAFLLSMEHLDMEHPNKEVRWEPLRPEG